MVALFFVHFSTADLQQIVRDLDFLFLLTVHIDSFGLLVGLIEVWHWGQQVVIHRAAPHGLVIILGDHRLNREGDVVVTHSGLYLWSFRGGPHQHWGSDSFPESPPLDLSRRFTHIGRAGQVDFHIFFYIAWIWYRNVIWILSWCYSERMNSLVTVVV